MDTPTLRCQSCGMPLAEGFFGTNQDTSPITEYCKFCFQNGSFTELHLTLEAMIQKSTNHMMRELNFSEEKASTLAKNFIPTLKRWQ